jgi:hypothetical protein
MKSSLNQFDELFRFVLLHQDMGRLPNFLEVDKFFGNTGRPILIRCQ